MHHRERETVADSVLSQFLPLILSNEQEIATLGTVLPIPQFDSDDILELCRTTLDIVKKQPHALELKPPVFIIGDIHGDLHDLLRIFNRIQEFDNQILMLGDYIDRGGFSLEVCIVLFAMVSKFPNNFFLLRGNHEFPNVLSENSLEIELKAMYGKNQLFEEIHRVFSYLPLVATIGDQYFCVHGGISQHFNSIDDVKNLEYPIASINHKLVEELLWSDPCTKITNYLESTRGRGVLFGAGAVKSFMENTGYKMVIRAHQCVINGISKFADCVITVFSSSFYNSEENKGAFIYVNEDFEIESVVLTPLRPIRRQVALFANAPSRCKSSKHIPKSLLAAKNKVASVRYVKPPLARPRTKSSSASPKKFGFQQQKSPGLPVLASIPE
ncbi:Serine/threonine-protein phosphatase PP1-2 [Tritrichomonas foetus]|uniref:Serine/threonine-protein phosphatase n=1 Tax=Tritrichomonas foetus TaxID=1144522 RepID=A0A1J4KXL5_9EUKA|nr:Serine/threonine-protein phosphatase PP1-2 [Tritrichomonas foetus]|eukprot:OHT15922.1 Serine/threonine-protein phosphatase PP1-2 [Tritrichomonas foetus]